MDSANVPKEDLKEEGNGGDMYNTVFETLTGFSFGKEIYADEFLMRHVREAIPQMHRALQQRQPNDVSNSIALDICYRVLGEKKLKPNDQRRLVFEAALVMLYYPIAVQQGILMDTTDQLFERYPEFATQSLDAQEAQALLKFRNFMVAAVKLISAHNHKNHLLELVTRLCEGRQVKYITGSGETLATSRRVRIYRKEGGVLPTPKAVKTKAEREAIAALNASKQGLLGGETLDDGSGAYSDEDDGDDEDVSRKKRPLVHQQKSSSKTSQRNPPKKRHNHRQLDDFDTLASGPAGPTTLAAVAAQQQQQQQSSVPALMRRTFSTSSTMSSSSYKTLDDIAGAHSQSQLEMYSQASYSSNGSGNGNGNGYFYNPMMGPPLKLAPGVEFQLGIDGDNSNSPTAGGLPSPPMGYQISLDENLLGMPYRPDRQLSLETVGTNEHNFFRQPLMETPELFGFGNNGAAEKSLKSPYRGLSSAGIEPLAADREAIDSLVMLRTQST